MFQDLFVKKSNKSITDESQLTELFNRDHIGFVEYFSRFQSINIRLF